MGGSTPALSSLLPVGLLGRPHGVRGELGLRLFGEKAAWPPTAWTTFWAETRAGLREFRIRMARPTGDAWLLALDGIADRDAAAALTNARVLLPRELLPPLSAGEFYVADTIGLAVRDQRGALLGVVKSTFWNGAQDVAVVCGAEGSETLLPLVAAVVKGVDLEACLMTVEWEVDGDEPEGRSDA